LSKINLTVAEFFFKHGKGEKTKNENFRADYSHFRRFIRIYPAFYRRISTPMIIKTGLTFFCK